MKRTACNAAALALLSLALPSTARSADPPKAATAEQTARWPVPAGWKHESFPLPPDFASELPYHGTEDLRFMPGYFSPEAPDFWSYAFVWWLDQPPAFDAKVLAASLTTYYRGLSNAVGGSKYKMDPAYFRTVLSPVQGSNGARWTGQAFTYDVFKTGKPITLNVEAELRTCTATKQFALVMTLSPKDSKNAVWKSLRESADKVVCK